MQVDWLAHAVVGDLVWIEPHHTSHGWKETTIARVTVTQILTADGKRWNRRTGHEWGERRYRSAALWPAQDPKAIERRRDAEDERRRAIARNTARNAMDEVRGRSLTTEAWERIERAIRAEMTSETERAS